MLGGGGRRAVSGMTVQSCSVYGGGSGSSDGGAIGCFSDLNGGGPCGAL